MCIFQAAGIAYTSLESHFLEQKLSAHEELQLKWAAAGLYAAGTDTVCTHTHSNLMQPRHWLMS